MNVTLLGLDSVLADELTPVLRHLGHSVRIAERRDGVLEVQDAELIFAGNDDFQEALQLHPPRPVIVTSRLPEMKNWIAPLEAGAADYCGAPFEATQIRWVLNTAMAA